LPNRRQMKWLADVCFCQLETVAGEFPAMRENL
jgi:hypothetical protein